MKLGMILLKTGLLNEYVTIFNALRLINQTQHLKFEAKSLVYLVAHFMKIKKITV